jgi:hypothetical protein
MPLIGQNFSISAGDNKIVSLDIDPDIASMVGTNLTFRAYDQSFAVPTGDAVVTKNLDDGLEISDPDYGIVLITFVSDDTIDLTPKNYAFEITTYDPEANRITVTQGIMTINRTKNPKSLS